MRRIAIHVARAAVGAACALLAGTSAAEQDLAAKPVFTAAEIKIILSHGPWPALAQPDPSNRVSGQADAIEFGTRLFFDQRLSGKGTVACASCHVPERNWSDNLRRGVGMSEVDRNTPTVMNLAASRWYGWDGASDSLWSQSLRPILDERELAATPRHVAQLVRNDEQLSCRYRKAFGTPPSPTDDEAVLVDAGKALAAFQETLVSGRTPFDRFRDALAGAERPPLETYSEPAQRGLKIFIGKGGCTACHSGPNFTGGEFFATGLSPGRNPQAAGKPLQPARPLQRRQDGRERSAHARGASREGEFGRVQGAVPAQPDTHRALWPRRRRRDHRRGGAPLRRPRSGPPARDGRKTREAPEPHPGRADRAGRLSPVLEHVFQFMA